jgi:hypothetical protein
VCAGSLARIARTSSVCAGLLACIARTSCLAQPLSSLKLKSMCFLWHVLAVNLCADGVRDPGQVWPDPGQGGGGRGTCAHKLCHQSALHTLAHTHTRTHARSLWLTRLPTAASCLLIMGFPSPWHMRWPVPCVRTVFQLFSTPVDRSCLPSSRHLVLLPLAERSRVPAGGGRRHGD